MHFYLIALCESVHISSALYNYIAMLIGLIKLRPAASCFRIVHLILSLSLIDSECRLRCGNDEKYNIWIRYTLHNLITQKGRCRYSLLRET